MHHCYSSAKPSLARQDTSGALLSRYFWCMSCWYSHWNHSTITCSKNIQACLFLKSGCGKHIDHGVFGAHTHHSHITSYRYTDTTWVYRHLQVYKSRHQNASPDAQNTSPDTQKMNPNTHKTNPDSWPKIQILSPKCKSRHQPYKSRCPQYLARH